MAEDPQSFAVREKKRSDYFGAKSKMLLFDRVKCLVRVLTVVKAAFPCPWPQLTYQAK